MAISASRSPESMMSRAQAPMSGSGLLDRSGLATNQECPSTGGAHGVGQRHW